MPEIPETDSRPLGSPTGEAVTTFVSGIVSLVPVVGPVVSSAIAAGMQASTTAKLNRILSRLETDIRGSGRAPEELLEDAAFRAGIAQLYLAAFRQEADEKLERIRNFLRHRMVRPGPGSIVDESVLRAFERLPSPHIEAFLGLIAKSEADLRDFSMIEGTDRFTASNIVKAEFPDPEGQEHCGSPADRRYHELAVLFSSLEGAGLVREIAVVGGPGYETTELSKNFVAYCLPPVAASR